MRWVLDGYNLIRRDPDLHAREQESLTAEEFLDAVGAPAAPPGGRRSR